MRHRKRSSSEQGYESTAHHLLNRWADINLHEPQTCGRNKDTPLQKANKRGHESITVLLLDKETDTSPCKENKKLLYIKPMKEDMNILVFFIWSRSRY